MIYHFTDSTVQPITQIGGKAKALMETSQKGYPIPEGIVLSVDFFEPWMTTIKASEPFNLAIQQVTKDNWDNVKRTASKMTFTKEQQDLLTTSMIDGDVFAVRSSSPEEDLEGTSFAGMYETYLGTTRPMLQETIALAFASCFDFRVMEYKNKNQMDLKNTCIAVVIQKQIASDVSGVGFSLNPMNNCYDEIMINASFGLGETIVSGIVSPDTYIVDSHNMTLMDKKINDKQIALWLNKEGGILQKDNENPRQCALTEPQIIELAKLIKTVAIDYNHPMDIEWAYENGQLYLLQSRPITTFIPFFEELLTVPGEPRNLYIDNIAMSQGFDTPMSVLGLELWSIIFETVKLSTTKEVDGTAPALHGKHYINQSYFRLAVGKRNGDSMISGYDRNVRKVIADLNMNKDFTPQKAPSCIKQVKKTMVTRGLKAVPAIFSTLYGDYNKVIENYLSTVNRLLINVKQVVDSDEAFDSKVNKVVLLLQDITTTAGFVPVGMYTLSQIRQLFKGMDIETEVSAMAMDLKGNPTSAMGHLMYKLASEPCFVETASYEAFETNYTNQTYPKTFMDNLNTYLNTYAMRGFMEIDIAVERTYESMEKVFKALKEINVDTNQISNVKEKRQAAYDKLLKMAISLGKEKKFKKLADKYQAIMGYREHPKYVIVQIIDLLRKECLKIGQLWAEQGRLHQLEEIFDLHVTDIAKAQRHITMSIEPFRIKNLSPYTATKKVNQWPLIIDSRGKIYKPKMEISDGDIQGDPIAPGIVKGRAKVLSTPYEKPLEAGEILVTRSTEPSWTPIFLNAAGVVMEIGGPLQHGGIIAREYGIPCVSGLMGVMTLIKDGALLEVNGNDGIVKIVQQ